MRLDPAVDELAARGNWRSRGRMWPQSRASRARRAMRVRGAVIAQDRSGALSPEEATTMSLEQWVIDKSHSGIHFSVRHMVIAKVRGQFVRWTGAVTAEDGDFTRAGVQIKIDATSIDTGVVDRDTHLKSPDFLDVAKHPEITFQGKRVESRSGPWLDLVGDLTIRGVTREVVLDVEQTGRTKDPWGHDRAGFAAKGSIDRGDFGLTWNQVLDTGGLVVGDRIDIEIEVEAVRQPATVAATG
jgi:polyisoprenoid-binding protein YceI